MNLLKVTLGVVIFFFLLQPYLSKISHSSHIHGVHLIFTWLIFISHMCIGNWIAMSDFPSEKPSVFSHRVQKAFRSNFLEGASLSYRLKCLQLEERSVRRFLRHRTMQTWDAMKQIQDVKTSRPYLFRRENKELGHENTQRGLNRQLETDLPTSISDDQFISRRRRRIEQEVTKKKSCLIRNCPIFSHDCYNSTVRPTRDGKRSSKRDRVTKVEEDLTKHATIFGGKLSSALLYSRYSLPPLPLSAPGFSRQPVRDCFSDSFSDSVTIPSRPSSSLSRTRDDLWNNNNLVENLVR